MTKSVQTTKVRIAKLNDCQADEAAVFLHRAWHSSYARRLPGSIVKQRTVQHFEDHLRARARNCWLAWTGDRLVGLLTTVSNCVDEVWVSRRYRRRGIASSLIDTACRDLSNRGFGFAQAGCEDFNDTAIALFETLGWQQIGAEPVEILPGIRHEARVYGQQLHAESQR